jgi:cytochrome b subunit of formate dehydrogenase
MTESIDKASSNADLWIWTAMFVVLVIAVIGLALWDKKKQEE